MHTKELEALLGILRANKVQAYRNGDLALEMHPDAWKAEPVADTAPSVAPEPSKICKCGHHLVSEHTEGGCLHGCAITLCESTLEEA